MTDAEIPPQDSSPNAACSPPEGSAPPAGRWGRALEVVGGLTVVLAVPTTMLVLRLVKEMTLWTWQRGPQVVGFSLAHGHGCALTYLGVAAGPALVVVIPVLAVVAAIAWRRGQRVPRWTLAALLWSVVVLGLSAVSYETWTHVTYSAFGPGPGGQDALAYAARRCDEEMFEELLAMGVPADPPDSALRDDIGLGRATPLGAAASASGECLPVVRRLIALGVDVNRRQSLEGSPPIVDAAFADNQRTVELLLEAGADINATDRNGETALDRARELDHDGLAAWLEAHGAESGAGRGR